MPPRMMVPVLGPAMQVQVPSLPLPQFRLVLLPVLRLPLPLIRTVPLVLLITLVATVETGCRTMQIGLWGARVMATATTTIVTTTMTMMKRTTLLPASPLRASLKTNRPRLLRSLNPNLSLLKMPAMSTRPSALSTPNGLRLVWLS